MAGERHYEQTTNGLFQRLPPEKLPFPLKADCEAYIKLQADITRSIMESVRAGYTRFLSGMARGFDLIASGILLEMKGMFPVYAGVKLVAVLPFLGHGFHGRWGGVHDMILEEASLRLRKPGTIAAAGIL